MGFRSAGKFRVLINCRHIQDKRMHQTHVKAKPPFMAAKPAGFGTNIHVGCFHLGSHVARTGLSALMVPNAVWVVLAWRKHFCAPRIPAGLWKLLLPHQDSFSDRQGLDWLDRSHGSPLWTGEVGRRQLSNPCFGSPIPRETAWCCSTAT